MKRNFFIYLLIFIVIILAGTCVFLFYKYETKKCVTIKNEVKDILNPNYVFLGDSITDFYDLSKYYEGLPIVNSGINGNSTKDILENMQDRVYRYNPSKVIILIGVNDVVYDISMDETISNIDKIIKGIKNNLPNCEIYVESIYPVNNDDDDKINQSILKGRNNDTIKSLNKEIVKIAKKEKVNYINVYDLLKDENDNLKLEYTRDGIHLTNEAYEIVTKKIKESIL